MEEVRLLDDDFEYNTVEIESLRARAELRRVFPQCPADESNGLRAVLTVQRTRVDLGEAGGRWRDGNPPCDASRQRRDVLFVVARGLEAEEDKRRAGERFIRVAKGAVDAVRAQGYWADIADPATGYPIIGERGGETHNDLETLQRHLRYRSVQVGSCCVLEHPRWGTRCYPACFFVDSPAEVLQRALEQAMRTEMAPWEKSPHTSVTGIYLVPPRHMWDEINNIRCSYFDDLRLGPHVSMVDPFVVPSQLDRACDLLQSQLGAQRPFQIRLARLDLLVHNERSVTIFAVPESDPPDALAGLSVALTECFPMCNDLVRRGGGVLTPHVSVARAQSLADARALCARLQQSWHPVEWTVRHVQVLLRDRAQGTGQPFSLFRSVPLAFDTVAQPNFGDGSAEWSDDHPCSRTVILFNRFQTENSIALRNPRGGTLREQAVQVFPSAEEANAFVRANHGRCALQRQLLFP